MQLEVKLPDDVYARAQARATELGITVEEFLKRTLEEYVARMAPEPEEGDDGPDAGMVDWEADEASKHVPG